MSIQVKKGGAYADVVGIFAKKAGVYAAVAGVFCKVGGVYGQVDTSPVPAPVAVISTDAATIPAVYISTNDSYFRTTPGSVGYTGILQNVTGYQGHGVMFSGWDSTGFIVRWRWDWGVGSESDYGGRYFEGINGGHVYETAGTYTVTLTVTDYLGRTSTATRTVTIYAGGAGNTSIYGGIALNTYYVDSVAGNDAWDGKSQTYTSGVNGPWQTAKKVQTILKKNNGDPVSSWSIKAGDRILFKRGQTFTFDAGGKDFGHGGLSQGVFIGAYGSGANPIIQYVTPPAAVTWAPSTAYTVGQFLIAPASEGKLIKYVTTNYTSSTSWGATDVNNVADNAFIKHGVGAGFITFADLEFRLRDGTTSCLTSVFNSTGKACGIAAVRCTFQDQFNCAISTQSTRTVAMTDEPFGVFALGCTFSQSGYPEASIVTGLFGEMTGLAMIGCTMDSGGNHLNYLSAPNHSVFADNVFCRPAFGRTALRIVGGPVAAKARRFHITRNKFAGWIDPYSTAILSGQNPHNGGGTRYNFTLVNLSNNGYSDQYIEDVVFDRNEITNYEYGLTITNAVNVTLKNNVFVTPAPTARHIVIGESGSHETRACDNINIYHNTFVANGSTGDVDNPLIYCQSYTAGSVTTNLRVKNNLAISIAGRDDHLLGFQRLEQVANVDSDYNLYQTGGTDFAKVVSTVLNKASWQSTYTKDVNTLSGTAGVVTAPTATSHTAGNPASSAACVSEADAYVTALHLAVGSQAIGAATPVDIYRDYDDAVRAAPHDIGAFDKA